MNAPLWLDKTLFPFESNYIKLESGSMHYIDENYGNRNIILLQHGTPVWSIDFSDIIKPLSKTYRVIAPDLIGFGLSEKVKGLDYSVEAHSKRFSEFINKLNLDFNQVKLNIVLHDFGGPIGLNWVLNNIKKINSLTLINTWGFDITELKEFQKAKMIKSFLGKFLYLYMNFSPKNIIPMSYYDKSKLSKKLHKQFLAPFPDSESRIPLYKFAEEVLDAKSYYKYLENNISKLNDINVQILWGLEDKFIPYNPLVDIWKKHLPNVKIHNIENTGHFPHIEKPFKVIENILSYIN